MIWPFHHLHFTLDIMGWHGQIWNCIYPVLSFYIGFFLHEGQGKRYICIVYLLQFCQEWKVNNLDRCVFTHAESGSKSSHRQTHPHSETTAKMDTPARTIHFSSRQRLQLGFISSAALSGCRALRHSWMNHLYGLITGSFSPEPTHPPSSALFVQAPLSNWGNFPAAAPISNACPL